MLEAMFPITAATCANSLRSVWMLANLVKRLGHRAGIELRRYRPYAARRATRLSGIGTVIDVGANAGQYGSELRAFGYRGRIVSLEPLAAPFAELSNRSADDPAWECLNVAAGSSSEEAALLNVASSSASSSFLVMRGEHMAGAPSVTYIGKERVTVRRLDSLDLVVEGSALFKIDVQGYEAEVLAGAGAMLSDVSLIECELLIADLYEGQPSFYEMVALLAGLGFELVDLDPFFYDPSDGRVLAVDALLSR